MKFWGVFPLIPHLKIRSMNVRSFVYLRKDLNIKSTIRNKQSEYCVYCLPISLLRITTLRQFKLYPLSWFVVPQYKCEIWAQNLLMPANLLHFFSLILRRPPAIQNIFDLCHRYCWGRELIQKVAEEDFLQKTLLGFFSNFSLKIESFNQITLDSRSL